MGDFLKLEGAHFISSVGVGKVNFPVCVAIIDNILCPPIPADKSVQALDRDLALIRSLLIVTKLNV